MIFTEIKLNESKFIIFLGMKNIMYAYLCPCVDR